MPLVQLVVNPDRGGCSPRAGESLHTDGRIYQVDLEWRCGHRRSSVAAECFWTSQLALRDPCGKVVLARRERCIVAAKRSRDGLPTFLKNQRP